MNLLRNLFAVVLGLTLSGAALAGPTCYDHGRPLPLTQGMIGQYMSAQVMYREIYVTGEVTKILPTDFKGRQHEKFMINVEGNNVEIVHNLSLAPAVPVQPGNQITICGEFLMAGNMPMIHWTHYDPSHRHGDGFMIYNNQVFGARPGRNY